MSNKKINDLKELFEEIEIINLDEKSSIEAAKIGSKLKKTGKHPVKLTVYYLGHKRRYGLPFSFTEAEWEKLFSAKLRDNTLKEAKVKLNYYKGEKFEAALKKIEGTFDFDKFKAAYIEDNSLNLANRDVYSLFNRYIAEMQKIGSVGNEQVYTSALKTFQNFRKRKKEKKVTNSIFSQLIFAGEL
jgi:hypothetical protein